VANGRTVVRHLYFTPPFKVMKPFPDEGSGGLEIMLMECSPGILADDRQEIRITLEPGARLKVTGQSYGKIFTMQEGEARQEAVLKVGSGARLVYLPEPMVPFQGSRFQSVQRVELAAGAGLFWSEMVTPGRMRGGEVFLYDRYQTRLEVSVDGDLIYWDQLRLRPGELSPGRLGLFEAWTHYGQVVWVSPNREEEALQELLGEQQDVRAAWSALHGGHGFGVRLLGRSAESVKRVVHSLADAFGRQAGSR